MDAKQIDVMVADASHEAYVDTILDTIREAAKCGAQALPNVRTNMSQPK